MNRYNQVPHLTQDTNLIIITYVLMSPPEANVGMTMIVAVPGNTPVLLF